MDSFIKWLRKIYNKSIHRISIYPGLISLFFLLFFILIYHNETSGFAATIKRNFVWLNLKNTEAARAILTTIATGIIGLTVFSFSMVMVVMVQAASQMSNRILDSLIGNRLQQVTLGFYLGTIVASFFLLSIVDDKGTEEVPSLSVFLLALLTIIDLFLFVSFLHHITQSVRFEQLIKHIHKKTIRSLDDFTKGVSNSTWQSTQANSFEVVAPLSGYFQGVNRNLLLKFLSKRDWKVEFYFLRCTYIVTGEPFLKLYGPQKPTDKELQQLFESLDFYTGQEIDKNPYYGFLHLSEVAIKGLSPGINDPNTAVLCIHALTDLLIWKMHAKPVSVLEDKEGVPRVFIPDHSFEDLFRYCVPSIWDYGKKDRFIRAAFERMLQQLAGADKERRHTKVLMEFKTIMDDHHY